LINFDVNTFSRDLFFNSTFLNNYSKI